MQYTNTQVNKLIEELEKELGVFLAKAEEGETSLAKSEDASVSTAPSVDGNETLAKAEDEKPAKAEEEKEDKKDEAPKSSEQPAAEAKEGEKPAEAPAQQEGQEAPAAEAKPEANEAAAPSDEHCDYDDEDLEHMQKMYSSMSRGELKAHHDAVKQCLDSMGMEKCGDMAMQKTETQTIEVKPEVTQPSPEVELLKSEVSAKTAKIDELQKSLELVTEFVAKLAKKAAPAGKAITSLEAIAKSEVTTETKELSKGEITTLLAKKAADPSLSKSDRDAINAYYLTGASINKISHLLK
jgi:hypothetical protein